jgi:hypothetical protein
MKQHRKIDRVPFSARIAPECLEWLRSHKGTRSITSVLEELIKNQMKKEYGNLEDSPEEKPCDDIDLQVK